MLTTYFLKVIAKWKQLGHRLATFSNVRPSARLLLKWLFRGLGSVANIERML